eukprot:Nitzschia sp. Nitz4//scaffold15_size197535//183360//183800//NITZ4_001611-RA/size197535-processed-gene-0.105-mRNA-1//-1//CDS//3329537814//8846//frame0
MWGQPSHIKVESYDVDEGPLPVRISYLSEYIDYDLEDNDVVPETTSEPVASCLPSQDNVHRQQDISNDAVYGSSLPLPPTSFERTVRARKLLLWVLFLVGIALVVTGVVRRQVARHSIHNSQEMTIVGVQGDNIFYSNETAVPTQV